MGRGARGRGAAAAGWFVPLQGSAWCRRRDVLEAARRRYLAPESRSASPPFGWLPLTLLLSYKYAFPASASILAPTHSPTRTESACSEEKPSPASEELLSPSSSGLAEEGCPPLPRAIPAAPGAPSGGQEHRGERLCRSRRLKLAQLRCSKNR